MNVKQLSSASLSYLGDSVIELCVRRYLVSLGISHSAELNRIALDFVKASAQAEAVKKIMPFLTEEEKQYLESLFPEEGSFQFGHPDRLDAGKQVVTEAYRSRYSLIWQNARTGLWKNCAFQIIEC